MKFSAQLILIIGTFFSSNTFAAHGHLATVKGHLISWDNNKAVISVATATSSQKKGSEGAPVRLTVARKYFHSATKFVEGEYVMAMIPLAEDLTLQPMPNGQ